MNIKKQFGEKIKRIRKQRGFTQEKLSEMIDISPRNLSGIEKGIYFVKADTLEKIICPGCGKEMKKIFLNGQNVYIDICLDGCGGILFDNREFSSLENFQHACLLK